MQQCIDIGEVKILVQVVLEECLVVGLVGVDMGKCFEFGFGWLLVVVIVIYWVCY